MAIKRKWITTIEVQPDEEYQIPKNHQVISSKVLISERADPGFPEYKTVIVLQGVEYDEEGPREFHPRQQFGGVRR